MSSLETKLRNATILAFTFCFAAVLTADGYDQEKDPKREVDTTKEERRMRVIDEANTDRRTGKSGAAGEKSEIISNGKVRITTTVDRRRDVKIVEDPKRGIMIEVTQHFGGSELQQLKDQHPELRDYIDLFPKQTGNQEIELSISLKKKFEAPDAKRLKVKSLFAFGIYRRHVQENGDHMAKFQ